MKKAISIIDIFRELPLEEMANDIKDLHMDYKAKKLDTMTVFALLVQGFLTTERLSQRYVCKGAQMACLKELFKVDVYCGHICHSSLSERLGKINPKFFMDTYNMLYHKVLREYGPFPLLQSNITRVDTSCVTEAANKLKEGIRSGVNDRYGGERKLVKYGIAYDGLGVPFAEIFTSPRYSGDELALGFTVKSSIRRSHGALQVYTFDRGTGSSKNLKEISDMAQKKGDYFVARLKLNRHYEVFSERPVSQTPDPDGEYEIIRDSLAYLKKPKSSLWDKSVKYRVIRVRFAAPRPKSASKDSHRRKYQDEMVLITNDFDSDTMKIALIYKARWSVEVFFKFLKQNLSFSHLMCVNPNGIQVMLYMTLIMALLVKLYALETNQGPKMAIADIRIQISNWLYLHGGEHSMPCTRPRPHRKRETTHEKSSDH